MGFVNTEKNVWILKETIGGYEGEETNKKKGFLTMMESLKYQDELDKFRPDSSMSEGCIRSCLYELSKKGYGLGWKNTDPSLWPYFTINKIKVILRPVIED